MIRRCRTTPLFALAFALAAAGAGAQSTTTDSGAVRAVPGYPGSTAGTVTIDNATVAAHQCADLAPAQRAACEKRYLGHPVPRRSGVDLGVQRKADGTLYDALDPTQNPAAATSASGTDTTTPRGTTAEGGAAISPAGADANANAGGNAGTRTNPPLPGASGGRGIVNSGTPGNGLDNATSRSGPGASTATTGSVTGGTAGTSNGAAGTSNGTTSSSGSANGAAATGTTTGTTVGSMPAGTGNAR